MNNNRWIHFLIIFVVAFLVNGNTLQHGYVLDDDVVFLKNKHVQQGTAGIVDLITHSFIHGYTGTNDQSYRPVVLVAFALEREFLGNNPRAQHILNVLFYALAVSVLYLFLINLLRDRPTIVSLLISLLFLVHPVHTEVVANIKGLDEILNAIFLFGSLWYLLRYVDTGQNNLNLVLSLGGYLLALLSKESSVTFLAIIPLLLYFFRDLSWRKIIPLSALYLVPFAVYWSLRVMLLDNVTFGEEMSVLNNALAAADGVGEKLATAFLILGHYIKLLVVPHPLSFDYSFNQIPIVGFGDPMVWLVLLLFAGLGGVVVKGWKKKDPVAFAVLFFFITMSIVSNVFIEIGSTMGERFLFIPSLAFCLALVLLAYRILNKVGPKKGSQPVLIGMIVIMTLFAWKTYDRNKDWESNEALFLADAEACPNSTRIQGSLGFLYRERALQERDPNAAQQLLQQSVAYYGRATEILYDNFDAWYNKGVAQGYLGDQKGAFESYTTALEINPGFVVAHNNLGTIYFDRQDYDKARYHFGKAVELQPENYDAWGNLGAVEHNLGDLQKALFYYEKSLAISLNNPNTLQNAIRAFEATGNVEKANYYRQFVR